MKHRLSLAALFLTLPIAAAAADNSNAPAFQRGHAIGGSIVYLVTSPEIKAPPPLSTFDVNTDEEMKALMTRVKREQAEADANSGGAPISFSTNPDGSPRMLYQSQKACAVFEAWAEQSVADFEETVQMGFTSVDRTKEKVILRRFLRDEIQKIYVSYSVTVEAIPKDGTYRLSFGPSTDAPPAPLIGRVDWKFISPASYPMPQIVSDEDSVGLELYSIGTQRRVIDYVHVGRQDRMILRKESPHDYYAADAEFNLTHPHFRVNGVSYEEIVEIPETIRGPLLWVYVPGYGKYVLSLHPSSSLGFERGGEVSGNSMTFTSGNSVFTIVAAERIAGGSGTYTVNLSPDLAWVPADPRDRERVMIGAAIGLNAAYDWEGGR